jgi:hypothetical protein
VNIFPNCSWDLKILVSLLLVFACGYLQLVPQFSVWLKDKVPYVIKGALKLNQGQSHVEMPACRLTDHQVEGMLIFGYIWVLAKIGNRAKTVDLTIVLDWGLQRETLRRWAASLRAFLSNRTQVCWTTSMVLAFCFLHSQAATWNQLWTDIKLYFPLTHTSASQLTFISRLMSVQFCSFTYIFPLLEAEERRNRCRLVFPMKPPFKHVLVLSDTSQDLLLKRESMSVFC